MAIDTQEIELHAESLQKFGKENPQALRWLLHNFDAIKNALDTGGTSDDLTALEASITSLQTLVSDLQTQVNEIPVTSEFDPSALQAAIADLQAQVDAIVIPVVPPPFAMPDGLVDQVLTHGPGGNGDFFFADLEASGIIYAPAQTGDLIPVNEATDDEALLPEFLLTDDGAIMMIPVA